MKQLMGGAFLILNLVAVYAAATATADFNWNNITPSSYLQYEDCYGKFQCARLLLPLDWRNETDTKNVTIAITKLPATVGDDDPLFGGTIIAQPGGPGVSGTLYLRNRSDMLRDLVDIPGEKHYEILSFDPRGLGYSTPSISCSPGLRGFMRQMELRVNGAVDISAAALAFALAAAKADGDSCTEKEFLSHVGTPNVARDMLAIVDKVHELQQKNYLLNDVSRLELRSHAKDIDLPPRLQYIGISYGTVLGNYFAAMFPGRVGRMVLDGLVNIGDYVQGHDLLTTTDTDSMANMFLEGCFDAGKLGCALYRQQDTTAADLKHRFWSWVESLDTHPLLVESNTINSRLFIRSGDIKVAILMGLYHAVFAFKSLAEALDSATRGNASALSPEETLITNMAIMRTPNANTTVADLPDPMNIFDSQSAILCADGPDLRSTDLSYWNKFLSNQLSISSLAGAFITNVRLPCAGWQPRPKWIFNGPFTTPRPSKSSDELEENRPAAPILHLSNRYDPITPLVGARVMVKHHPQASLVIQETMGHCVILGAIGPCVKKIVSEYFHKGIVPSEDEETICDAIQGPWD